MTIVRKHLLTAVGALMLGAAAAAGAQVVVRIGPPRPPREVIPAARPGYAWHPGYHRYDGGRYVWTPGEYVAAPRPGARWVPGHWANHRGGYVWMEGHWRY